MLKGQSRPGAAKAELVRTSAGPADGLDCLQPQAMRVLVHASTGVLVHPRPRPPGETPRVEQATRSTKSYRPWLISHPAPTSPSVEGPPEQEPGPIRVEARTARSCGGPASASRPGGLQLEGRAGPGPLGDAWQPSRSVGLEPRTAKSPAAISSGAFWCFGCGSLHRPP